MCTFLNLYTIFVEKREFESFMLLSGNTLFEFLGFDKGC